MATVLGKVSIGSDHGGFEAKGILIAHLEARGVKVLDRGTYSHESCDYPLFAYKVANDVKDGLSDFGILICNSGEGMAIAANKIAGVRAALLYNKEVAKLAREHNHANVITFGASFFTPAQMLEMLAAYMQAEPLGDRHQRRVDEITAIDDHEDPEEAATKAAKC